MSQKSVEAGLLGLRHQTALTVHPCCPQQYFLQNFLIQGDQCFGKQALVKQRLLRPRLLLLSHAVLHLLWQTQHILGELPQQLFLRLTFRFHIICLLDLTNFFLYINQSFKTLQTCCLLDWLLFQHLHFIPQH